LSAGQNGHKIVVMKSRRAGKPNTRTRSRVGRSIAAAGFKARCLELMDRVRETGVEYIVTKHGEPVAKLVPYTARQPTPLFGSMSGTVLKYERPFDPIDGDWAINRD
jgi:prevent-host-death family protein